MGYTYAADAVAVVHFAYVGFIVVGLLAVLLGTALSWGWVRNLWFRIAHLLAIVIVAGEALLRIDCPLTVWESEFRRRAGQDVSARNFVGRCLDQILFYHFEPWVFTVLYTGLALLVLALFLVTPPRLRTSRR
jgi:hypothetical protein